MTRLLLVCALAGLAWDSAAALLEIRDLTTGIKTQCLFQEATDCSEYRRELMARPGANRTFIVSDCDRDVALPWEPQGANGWHPWSGLGGGP